MPRFSRLFAFLCLSAILADQPNAARAEDKKTPLHQRLYERVHIDSDDERVFTYANATVQSALDWVAKNDDFSYQLNSDAFDPEGGTVKERLSARLLDSGPFPVRDMPLGVMLNRILARMPGYGDEGAIYLLRKDHVEITTRRAVRREVFGPTFAGPYLPLVHVDFDKVALGDALKALERKSGQRICLFHVPAELTTLPVSISFRNTPADTAVRLLADRADLTSFRFDGILYVTTLGRAQQLADNQRLGFEAPGLLPTRRSLSLRFQNITVLYDSPEPPLSIDDCYQRIGEMNNKPIARNDVASLLEDPKTTMKDMLDYIAVSCRFSYEINERAFETPQGATVEDCLFAPLLKQGPLNLEDETPMFTLLDKVLSRMPGEKGQRATFLIRRDHIEFTTVAALRREVYGRGYPGPFLQIVDVDFKNRALNDALADVAAKAGINVVIDSRVGSAADKKVSLQMSNVDVDDVVRLLATMAGQRAYRIDNVFLVTSRGHAAELKARETDRERGFAAPP